MKLPISGPALEACAALCKPGRAGGRRWRTDHGLSGHRPAERGIGPVRVTGGGCGGQAPERRAMAERPGGSAVRAGKLTFPSCATVSERAAPGLSTCSWSAPVWAADTMVGILSAAALAARRPVPAGAPVPVLPNGAAAVPVGTRLGNHPGGRRCGMGNFYIPSWRSKPGAAKALPRGGTLPVPRPAGQRKPPGGGVSAPVCRQAAGKGRLLGLTGLGAT